MTLDEPLRLTRPPEEDEHEFYIGDEPDDEDEMDEAEMNCGEMPEGGCSLAGTEWCDWECPFSGGMMRRLKARGTGNETI